LEINPPRGADVESVLARCRDLSGIDFVNVTDSALAKMRMSGVMFASLLKQRTGIEPLVNLACRDRNIIALQSELLGAWALGIRSIIALTGDAVTVGDLPDAKGVFEVNSIGLLNIIASLNRGKDLAGTELKGAPAFLPGVVVNPNARNRDAELKRLAKKRDAGAVYALSQPVFDAEHAAQFFEAAAGMGVQLFVGLLPFKSARTIEGISKVPGIKIPDAVVERVKASPEAAVSDLSMELALDVARRVRPFVRGFHVVAGGTPLLALELCQRLISWIRESYTRDYDSARQDSSAGPPMAAASLLSKPS
jgi:5,10-methylenetetrahydrofolate reductase